MASRFDDFIEFRGGCAILDTLSVPPGSIVNTSFSQSPGNRLAASKVVHQQHVNCELAEQDTAVAAIERLAFIANAAGELADLKAAVITAADDATREVDIDLLKSTAGGAFATVLTAPLQFTDADTDLVVKTASLATAAYVAGDVFKLVVTVAGGAGNQAKGLLATIAKNENPS